MAKKEQDWKFTGRELPTTPENDAARLEQSTRYFSRGWIYIGREPERNEFTGWVEHSFAMGDDQNRTRFWRRRSDGWENPDSSVKPGDRSGWPMQFTLYDIDDPACPVYLDFIEFGRIKAWEDKHDRIDKFGSRNLKFIMKSDEVWDAQRAFLATLEAA